MIKGKIRRLDNLDSELVEAQESFILDAENNIEKHFEDYIKLESSINGKYVCSDLFKETFPLYSSSVQSRGKYNRAVHNSAACLASEYFDRLVSNDSIKKCIFLSGVPGAGKSYLIQSIALSDKFGSEKIDIDDTMIYEGDITTESIYEKMDKCVENNKDIFILIVNPTLELAQRNTIKRKLEIGRGVSCETMARILSKIPGALKEIFKRYDVELGIYDKKTNYDIDYRVGKEFASMLDHGNYEELLKQLQVIREQVLQEIENENKELGDDGNEPKKIC